MRLQELLQLLLEERADVNLNAKDGRTPLYAACECGHHAIASRLLRLGIPVDATRTGGSTALVAAVRPASHRFLPPDHRMRARHAAARTACRRS